MDRLAIVDRIKPISFVFSIACSALRHCFALIFEIDFESSRMLVVVRD